MLSDKSYCNIIARRKSPILFCRNNPNLCIIIAISAIIVVLPTIKVDTMFCQISLQGIKRIICRCIVYYYYRKIVEVVEPLEMM